MPFRRAAQITSSQITRSRQSNFREKKMASSIRPANKREMDQDPLLTEALARVYEPLLERLRQRYPQRMDFRFLF
jgi:hypothetical protein